MLEYAKMECTKKINNLLLNQIDMSEARFKIMYSHRYAFVVVNCDRNTKPRISHSTNAAVCCIAFCISLLVRIINVSVDYYITLELHNMHMIL